MSLSKNVVAWLEKNKQNVGIMADLRRGLRNETRSRAWPYINAFCNIMNEKEEILNRTVFGLYASHDKHSDKIGNFGDSLRVLAFHRGGNDGLKLHERYLKRFSKARDMKEICGRLPFIVKMMKSEGIPINYERLYTDLYYWGANSHDRERIPREWCQGYYYTEKEKAYVSNQNSAI
jgi:CRISPR type I-E/ECOLI-associated protein CasB/Cse2